jgi:enoyl-CoA hydratase
MENEHIIIRRQGVLGRLTLNRPCTLNALTKPMFEAVSQALLDWEGDPNIAAILIDAGPGRAFCAGGDGRAIYELGKAGDPQALEIFATEYRMNAAIARFPKPYISILDGLVLGGGAGISVHGQYRVATENTLFAMPETAIGFFPDVGGSFFLSRCPGKIGLYLGLTGSQIDAADMLYAGLATHYIPQAKIAAVILRFARGEDPEQVLFELTSDPGSSTLSQNHAAIDRVFGVGSLEKILIGLTTEEEWGAKTAELLRRRSPTSLCLVHRQLIEGAKRELESCLEMELAIAKKMLKGHDFYEGVRAVLVDKDQTPNWRPARIEDVDAEKIESFFPKLSCNGVS